jgi:putative ABC transport system permease protein
MFRTPPFSKAPLLLFRHRVVLAAIFGAAVILGLVVALTPQFLSSATSEALEREVGGRCDASYNGTMRPSPFGGSGHGLQVTERNRERLTEEAAGQSNLDAPRATVISPTAQATKQGADDTFPMVLLYKDGFEDRLEILEGDGGRGGVWIDEYAAEQYELGIGDVVVFNTIDIFSAEQVRVVERELPVTAITEDHAQLQSLHFWCGVGDLIGFTPGGDRKPPVGLVDLEVFAGDTSDPDDDAHYLVAEEYWELPVEHKGLTLTIAGEILDTFEEASRTIFFVPDGIGTDLALVAERVEAMGVALSTSVRPLAIVVILVAFGLVAAAGSYWVDRRHDELRLLSAIGVGPLPIGLKALLEMLVPIVVGVGVGALGSIPVAVWVGPGGGIEADARRDGLVFAVPGMVAALILVAVVAALRARGLLSTGRHRKASRWWSIPGAFVAVLGAYLLRGVIGDEAVVSGENELVGSVDPLVLLFPLLIFGAAGLLAAELILFLIPRVKDRWSGHSFYMASRRLVSSPGPVIVLLAGALIPIATLVYSAALTRSAEISVQAKGKVFIGSDVRAPVFGFDALPPVLADRSTYVRRAERVDLGGISVDFMVIDPETFALGAFWHSGFSDLSLERLVGVVDDAGSPLPAIAANAGSGLESGTVDLGLLEVPIAVESSVLSFPGARGDRPLIVVGKEAYESLVAEADLPSARDGTLTQLWVAGLTDEAVERALGEADIGFAFTTTIDEVLDLTKFQVIIWTFDFLELYAALAGVIVVGAILLYADTRQRARNLSYALAVRMGLTRKEHLRAGLIEIGGLVVAGALVGSLTANLAARTIFRSLDALPATPPSPLWVGTIDLITILVLLSVGVGWLASAAAQRTADNADVSELLRHGD